MELNLKLGTDETEKEETEIWKRWKRTEINLYFSEYFHFLIASEERELLSFSEYFHFKSSDEIS